MGKSHLILIPGIMCDEAVWEHQASALRDIADITIPDHGSLDSLTAMADAILERAPQRFALAGHSMGGRVAFEIFRRAPERVTAIALMDTACTPRATGATGAEEAEQRYRLLNKARTEGMHAMGTEWVQRMVHRERLSDTALMKAILDMIARKTPEIFEAQITALLNRPDARDVLPQIHCPSLILCGREDAWSVLSRHEEMAAMIPHGRVVVIENCGHMSTMERPVEVTTAMHNWLTASARE
jgi:pimeloyl-ACP methyl ester carboxylesterase